MSFFFFNDTATTEIYTLSLHDALPIFMKLRLATSLFLSTLMGRCDQHLSTPSSLNGGAEHRICQLTMRYRPGGDRKSTRLNSSHANISYAVFCLKKKNCILPCSPTSRP